MTSEPSEPAAAPRSPVTYLHVGTMDSGTSYLQDVLDRNAALLIDDGITYVGRDTRAGWDVLELQEPVDLTGAWTRLARQTRGSSAPARLFSIEQLSTAGRSAIEAIVTSLGRVQVVVTARDLVRTIPSAWQHAVKHGSTKPFDEFVDALIAETPSRTLDRFWRQHNLSSIVGRWADVVGPERVHVVTVPPDVSPPTLLWERFCQVLGTDPLWYDAAPRQTATFSLSYSDTELLRKINAQLGGVLSTEAYNRYVQSFLATEVMRPGPATPQEPGPRGEAAGAVDRGRTDLPRLGAGGRGWAVEHAQRLVSEVARSGVAVVGDLAELVPPVAEDAHPDAGQDDQPSVQYPETAVRTMVQLICRMSEMDPELDEPVKAQAGPAEGRVATRTQDRSPGRDRAAARRDRRAQRSSPVAVQPGHRTFLHIGTHKTGTSFIQSVMLRNRDELAAADVCYPTDHTNWRLQTHGVRDVLEQSDASRVGRTWGRLVDTILTSGHPTAVVSVERLSTATTRQARAFVASLQPSQVHVILTLRDLARVLPSDWQSKIKQGQMWSFDEYSAAAAQPQGSGGRANRVFWGHHDAIDVAKRWLGAVEPDHFHIVTVPPSGAPASLLWERFCSVLGIEPGRYDISQDAKSNFSLTYSDTEFLRQVNRSVGQSIDAEARKHWVTRYLANEVLRPASSEPAGADRPRLDLQTGRWVEARSAEIIAALRRLDVDVVGDLDELRPRASGSDQHTSKPAIVFPDRAADIVAALLRKLADVHGSVRAERRQVRRAAGTDGLVNASLGSGAQRKKANRKNRKNA